MAGTTDELVAVRLAQPERRAPRRRGSLAWLGVVPFFLYVVVFLFLPAVRLALNAFQTDGGNFTLVNIRTLFQAQYRDAYITSIKLSLFTALVGGLFGLFVTYAALKPGAPRFIRTALTTFSGVAANFAGVPLAFAFVATLGATGVVTKFLAERGFDLYSHGFNLFTFFGLSLAYIYFQLPLMILVIAPSIEGMKVQWREAATNLGASPFRFWWHVGLPVLLPSLLGATVLLFGNAFSAYATAYALTTGGVNIVPILIGNVMSGNVISDPHLGDALAFGMIVVISISVVLYAVLQGRSSKWLR